MKKNKIKTISFIVIAVIISLILGWFIFDMATRPKELKTSVLIDKIQEYNLSIAYANEIQSNPDITDKELPNGLSADNAIVGIVINPSNYRVYAYNRRGRNLYVASVSSADDIKILKDAIDSVKNSWEKYGNAELKNLVKDGTFWYDGANLATFNWTSLIFPVLSITITIVMFVLLFRQMSGGSSKAMSYAKSKARINSNIQVKFSDVAGADEEKEEVSELVDFLKNPNKFSALGARIPKGVLLVGPPGTGKTLIAKAVAGEAGVPFFSISGSDFVEMFVGVGASRVRDLFEAAKKAKPCIVFIDEIDAVGRKRGSGIGGGNDEREQTLNQLLVQMDGFEKNEGIIIIAATNRVDVLDAALLRAGRFDRQVMVHLPDVRGREAILKVHARNKPVDPSVNYKTIARITSGFSGAELENLLNESAILAARNNKVTIGNSEIFESIDKVIIGPQKKSRVVTETDKRITAYHEAGHAIVSKSCKYLDPVHEVSIIPRGLAGGYTMTRPDNDDNYVSKAKLKDKLCELMGGRVAEELVIHDVSTGASNDLQRLTDIARKMVTEWGMSDKAGLMTYNTNTTYSMGQEYEGTMLSEETNKLIDSEIRILIDEAHNRVAKILQDNRKALDTMARVLIERETIYLDEVDMIMNGATPEEIYNYMDTKEKNRSPFSYIVENKNVSQETMKENNTDNDI